MARTHPYTNSQAGLSQTLTQFRQSFPNTVDSSTLKKLGFAPNNESYVLNVLRFLGLIDNEGNKTEEASESFKLHDNSDFATAFSSQVAAAYQQLLDLHGDAAWSLDLDALIAFFRANDDTSAVVGKLQARTFQILAAFAGHGEVPQPRTAAGRVTKNPPEKKPHKKKKATSAKVDLTQPTTVAQAPPVGLTVRIEVNLPADGNQATYDRIFRSIRENLLNG